MLNTFHLVSHILEQGPAVDYKKLGKFQLLLTLFFLFTAFLGSTCYREYLFSAMTAVSMPNVPQSWEDLVNWKDGPIVTTYHYKEQGKRDSVIKRKLLEHSAFTGNA